MIFCQKHIPSHKSLLSFFEAVIIILLTGVNCLGQSYEIGQRSINPTDTARNGRSIPTEVFYPAQTAGSNVPVASSADSFPLLVFGHGFSMNFGPYGNLREELVKQGYVMIFPKTEIGPLPFPDHGALAADMAFLARLFLQKDTTAGSDFYQRLNGEVAAMGHSMGGGCSFVAAKNDPAFTALATLAPAETDVSAIGAASSLQLPSLIMAGTEDCVTPIPDNQQPMYDTLASACKTLAIIKEGTHCNFANSNTACSIGDASCQPDSDISRSEQHQRLFEVLVPWLNFHLRNQCTDFASVQNALADTSRFTSKRRCNYQLPDVQVTPGDTTLLCTGDSATFTTASSYPSYLWSSGDTTHSVRVTRGQSLQLVVTDSIGCQDTSTTVYAHERPQFTPPIATNGQAILCEGASIQLSTVSSFSSYQWSNGNTTSSLTIDEPGQYWVKAQNTKGCSGRSDTVLINEVTPTQPTIQKSDDSLITGSFVSYQWYRDEQPIEGADKRTLSLSDSGRYFVKVTDANGCVSTSDTLLYQSTSINATKQGHFALHIAPIPANKQINLQVSHDIAARKKVTLLSVKGNQAVRTLRWSPEKNRESIDVQDLPAGIYMLSVRVGHHSPIVRKVVIQ